MSFCELLDKMIADEKKAVLEYGKLEDAPINAPLAYIIVEGIIRDEAKHFELLKRLKEEICNV